MGTNHFHWSPHRSANRKAVNVGKPTSHTIGILEDEFSVVRSSTLMVGDRLDTDIAFGVNNGFRTALVLSGVTPGELACRVCSGEGVGEEKYVPTVVIPSAGYLGPGKEAEEELEGGGGGRARL